MTTDSAVTTPHLRTTLADFLTGQNSSAAGAFFDPQLVPYRGVLTPQHLDAPERETAALLQEAAVHDLGWLRRVVVRGEDRLRWLSGMVTNTVEGLAADTGAYNLVLNAQGRIQGDLYVWRHGDEFELEITADQLEALLTHLDGFIIMDDVELAACGGESALGLTGPDSGKILKALGLPELGEVLTTTTTTAAWNGDAISVRLYRLLGTLVPHYALRVKSTEIPQLWEMLRGAGANPAGAAALETLRVAEGIPAYGIDIQSRDLAQETGQTRALHFSKGCYLGQEIVERIRSRGQVHRSLRALELQFASNEDKVLPEAGAELRTEGAAADSKPAAVLTSVASLNVGGTRRVFAIGMVRAEAEVGNKALTYAGGTARILTALPQLTISHYASRTAAEETA